MKKLIVLGSIFFAYFASFVGMLSAGDATLTLDDSAGSSSFVVQDSDKTNQFKVNSDGQGYFAESVGIGTTVPGTRFSIKETADSSAAVEIRDTDNAIQAYIGTARDTNDLVPGSNGSDLIINHRYTSSGALRLASGNAIRMTILNDGNVGIGTTAPGTKLQVSGNVSANNVDGISFKSTGETNNNGGAFSVFRSNGARVWMVGNDGSIWGFNSDGSSYRYGIRGDGGDTFFNSSGGNVGIGTQAPSEKLEVSGNIKASGTVSQGSSKEYKKNISYVSTKDAMNALNKLNPVRFEYKTDDSGEKHLGFIAEDVPDLVAEQDRKHLNAMDITAVLTKVVQEQQKVIQQMKDEILRLRDKVETFSKL